MGILREDTTEPKEGLQNPGARTETPQKRGLFPTLTEVISYVRARLAKHPTPETPIMQKTPVTPEERKPQKETSDSKPPFAYPLEDIPEGEDGINWILQHREEVFPFVQKEIQFDNGGAPSPSKFCAKAVADHSNFIAEQGYAHYSVTKQKIQQAREEAGKLLGADSSEIAFKQNTVEGLRTVAERFNWQKGDKVVVLKKDKEYASNFSPWEDLKRLGVELVEVGDENGHVTVAQVAEALKQNPRMVALSSIGWKTGQRVDLEAVGQLIKDHNEQNSGPKTRFCVDGIQGLGIHPIDVKKANIDFLSAGGSKWLMAGSGKGIFYCSKDAMGEMRTTGLGASSLKDFTKPDSGAKENASVFEDGTNNYESIVGLGEAIRLANKLGQKNLERRVIELSNYLVQQLEAKGFKVFSPRNNPKEKSGMVLFGKPEWDTPEKVSATHNSLMDTKGNTVKPIWMSLRDGKIRACVSYYNTKEEIDELIGRLDVAA